jgi:hypothetical protein
MGQATIIRRNQGGGTAVQNDLKILLTHFFGEARALKREETSKTTTGIVRRGINYLQTVNKAKAAIKLQENSQLSGRAGMVEEDSIGPV